MWMSAAYGEPSCLKLIDDAACNRLLDNRVLGDFSNAGDTKRRNNLHDTELLNCGALLP